MSTEVFSSSLSGEIQQLFPIIVFQRKGYPNPYGLRSNLLIIRFQHLKITGSCPINDRLALTLDAADGGSCVEANNNIQTELPGEKHRDLLAGILTRMDIPEVMQPTIIDKIFLGVEAADVPGPPVFCVLVDYTLRKKMRLRAMILVDLECPEKARLDSFKDTAGEEACVICTESFECFDHNACVDEGIEPQLMNTRLPCGHVYHRDCIARWFERSKLCPLCRYKMPTIQDEKPSAPPRWRLNWPIILTVSAGGVLSVMVFCAAGRVLANSINKTINSETISSISCTQN